VPRVCTVCDHEKREDIDLAVASGKSNREIAQRFPPLRYSAIWRHKASGHVPSSIIVAEAERRGTTLLERAEGIYSKTEAILERAEESGRDTVSLSALRELRAALELVGRVTGELRDISPVTVNFLASPDFQAAVRVILEEVPHEVRPRLAARLKEISA
jgi:hypothetical protein